MDEKPEGSFLLRDSAQDEYLFSVSFRRYGRSLHARIEEQGHRFSFDCHDPGVFMSRNIPQLLDHYKVRLSSNIQKKKTKFLLDANSMMLTGLIECWWSRNTSLQLSQDHQYSIHLSSYSTK